MKQTALCQLQRRIGRLDRRLVAGLPTGDRARIAALLFGYGISLTLRALCEESPSAEALFFGAREHGDIAVAWSIPLRH